MTKALWALVLVLHETTAYGLWRWTPKGSAVPASSVYVDVIVDEVRRPNIDHVDVHVYVHDQS